MSYRNLSMLSLAFAAALLAPASLGQPTGADLFATGVFGSVGITAGRDGTLWATLPGSGNDDDAAVVVVTSDGVVHPFAGGLPSGIAGVPVGANHLLFDGTDLWVAVGAGNNNQRGYLYRFDTSSFTPGDPPIGPSDAVEVVNIGGFTVAEEFAASNVYGLALGPDGTLYMTDAAANAVFQRAPDGTLSVLATLGLISGVEAVPTGIVFRDGTLYVAAFTGAPWGAGRSRVFAIQLDGTVSLFRDGLTHTIDLAVDPRDGALTALRYGVASGCCVFLRETGRAVRLTDSQILADEFASPSAMTYDSAGDLYVVTSPFDGGEENGDIYRVSSSPVANEPSTDPNHASLGPAFPNPFRSTAKVAFELAEYARIRLVVYDALGREVTVLADGQFSTSRHQVVFDGAGLPSGTYTVRMTTEEGLVATRRVTVLR